MATKKKEASVQNLTTRQEVIADYFNGLEDADLHLDEAIAILGLKEGHPEFTEAHVLAIANMRAWINNTEASDYDRVAELYKERQAKLDPSHIVKHLDVKSSELASTETAQIDQAGHSNGQGNPLVPIAEQSYLQGTEAGALIHGKLEAFDAVIPQVVEGAYLKGLQAGIEQGRQTGKKPLNDAEKDGNLQTLADEALSQLGK